MCLTLHGEKKLKSPITIFHHVSGLDQIILFKIMYTSLFLNLTKTGDLCTKQFSQRKRARQRKASLVYLDYYLIYIRVLNFPIHRCGTRHSGSKNIAVYAHRNMIMASQLRVKWVHLSWAKGLQVHKHKAWSSTKLQSHKAPCFAALESFDSKKETLPL